VTGQLRAELLKQRSTQTTLYLFLAMFGLVAFAVALHVLALSVSTLSTHSGQMQVFEVGTKVGMIFAGLVGAMAITAEIRYGTIRPTFLIAPTRSRVIAAKLVVSGAAGLVFGLLAEGLMAVAATMAFAVRGIDGQLTSGDYVQLLLGGGAAASMWAMIGVGIGALVRNQAGTLVGLLTWMLLIENLLPGFVANAARFLPGAAGSELAGNSTALPAALAALLLVGYAALASTAGWIATLRRDVA
jgi:ABC-type transport system involved in multi-copper enzyme maturation permease subunit